MSIVRLKGVMNVRAVQQGFVHNSSRRFSSREQHNVVRSLFPARFSGRSSCANGGVSLSLRELVGVLTTTHALDNFGRGVRSAADLDTSRPTTMSPAHPRLTHVYELCGSAPPPEWRAAQLAPN